MYKTQNMYTASELNACEFIAVSGQLRAHMYRMGNIDPAHFCGLCISLARCIDYALAISEIPRFDWEFPRLLKQVCERRNECLLQAAIMVLMISVKTACENGWFSPRDSEELKNLAHEIRSAFCVAEVNNTETSSLAPTISTIMSRYYPQIKMDQILASLTAKPGYEAYVMDFQILKNVNSSPQDIWLFVAQIDNLETSMCIISPQQVNFLLNGKGVERRTNISMDDGPQLPTNVTKLLKYGINLLQVVGQFNGNYAIVVAYMSMNTTPVRPSLQDYVQPAVALQDSDLELVEGPSRVSLNCPISMKRIKTPVKGHSCKHHQCFDLDNYVDMNSRRPTWRCPHCNQSVCFNDIRTDQKMVKILVEVEVNVADVLIFANGSWKAATESNDKIDKQHNKTSNCIPDVLVLPQQEPRCTEVLLTDIMDLTEGDDEIDTVSACENKCINPVLANNQEQLSNPCTTNTSAINQNTPVHNIDSYWPGVYLPMHGAETSGGRIDGVSVSAPTSYMTSPVFTDASSPALNREPGDFHAPPLTTSVAPSQIAVSATTPLQQFSNFDMINDYGRFSSTSINTNRVPVGVQGLPVQTSTFVSQQRPISTFQMSPNPFMVNGSDPVISSVERHQQARSHLSSYPSSYMSYSLLQQHVGSWGAQGQSSPIRSSQPITTPPVSSQHPDGFRVPTVLVTDAQDSHHQQSTGQRMSHIRSQSPGLARSSAHLPQSQTHQGGLLNRGTSAPLAGQQQEQFRSSAQRASHVAKMQSQSQSHSVQVPPFIRNVHAHSRPLIGNTGGTVQPVTRPEGFLDSSAAGQDWRPTGRMRGSLSGSAYSDALNQFITQPTQPVPPSRPLTNMATSLSSIPYPLHVLRAMNMNATEEVNHKSTQPASTSG